MFLCSVLFSVWEQWDFFTAVYFSFISMSTVGFGDVIPGSPRYACVFFAFYFVGLALFSMCYAIIQQEYRKLLHYAENVNTGRVPTLKGAGVSAAILLKAWLKSKTMTSPIYMIVRWENQYMWALQLIDQEHQDLMEQQEAVEDNDKEDKDKKSTGTLTTADNASSIRWRSARRDSSDSDDETRTEDLSSADRNRCSTGNLLAEAALGFQGFAGNPSTSAWSVFVTYYFDKAERQVNKIREHSEPASQQVCTPDICGKAAKQNQQPIVQISLAAGPKKVSPDKQ
ncbi:Ion channel [Ancylostoma duodenale]|uniref:Ion channel n=1 Tax=Ancylostoma duodenale TaxID=51022 RepID=A0A0C2DD38_9BILA|nr:Ion channel [Ancylostoma duodenale]